MSGKRAKPVKPVKLPPGLRHGTGTAYMKYRCHCEPCRDWRRGVTERTAARKRGDLAVYEPPGRTHGRIATYNAGCHDGPDGGPCAECKAAARDARRRARRRTDLPVACVLCPATFRSEAGRRYHESRIHGGGG